MGAADSDAADDADLVAAKSGDEVAFLRLYRTVQPGLLRYVTVLVGRDAEDVCAEAWAQACRDISRVKDTLDDFRPWIARIARNRALDLKRAQRRRPADVLDEDDDPGRTADSAEDQALEELSTRDALALIAALPRDQAEAVMLRAVLGLDARSAGAVVGKGAGAIRTASYRGLNALARRLGDVAPSSISRSSDADAAETPTGPV